MKHLQQLVGVVWSINAPTFDANLDESCRMLDIHDGIPTIFLASFFYFTHAFLIARQNFSRKNKFAVDEVGFEFEQLKKNDSRGKGSLVLVCIYMVCSLKVQSGPIIIWF